jgi:para-aminobenzoate synthetase/4-amino-4-deoxychorismate lyase
MYDEARSQAPGFDEVILWNAHRQVTEATTANVVVEMNGIRVTSPVECGLLAGTYRADLLAEGAIEERVITLDDLQRASRIWLINSVYGSRDAVLG